MFDSLFFAVRSIRARKDTLKHRFLFGRRTKNLCFPVYALNGVF